MPYFYYDGLTKTFWKKWSDLPLTEWMLAQIIWTLFWRVFKHVKWAWYIVIVRNSMHICSINSISSVLKNNRISPCARVNLARSCNVLQANIYLFKANNRDTRKKYEIYSALMIKTLERRHRHHSGVLLLSLNIFHTFF